MKKQQIFIKGNTYSLSGMHAMCTETTCSNSSDMWKGVVVKAGKQGMVKGHYSEKLYTKSDWRLINSNSQNI